MEVFGRHLGVVDTILSTTLSFLLKMCYTLVYYFFIPVLIKGSLYKATRKQIRWTNVKEEEKMAKYAVYINAEDCTVRVKVDERWVNTNEEWDEIVSKINNKEIKAEVYYKGEKTQLCQMQGRIWAKGFGFIAPMFWHPCTKLFLALSNQE